VPIYEYQCESCEHIFEVQQKFSDPLVDACVKCGKSVRKVISAPGIMFKGSGWYVTDYSNKLKDPNVSKSNASPEGKQASEASGGSSEGGSKADSGSSSPKTDSSSNSSSTSSSGPSSSSPAQSAQTSSSSSPAKSGT